MEDAQRILARVWSRRKIFLRARVKDTDSPRSWRKPDINLSSRDSRLDHSLAKALTLTQGEEGSLGLLTS